MSNIPRWPLKDGIYFLPSVTLFASDFFHEGLNYFHVLLSGDARALEPCILLCCGGACRAAIRALRSQEQIKEAVDQLSRDFKGLSSDVKRGGDGVDYIQVPDVADTWRGWWGHAISSNIAQSHDSTLALLPGNRVRYTSNQDRIQVLKERLQEPMRLDIIVYAPMSPFAGRNPAEVLLKYVFNLRSAKREMILQGIPIRATIRYFLISAPRPTGSEFWAQRKGRDGKVETVLLTYFRNVDPNGNTAMANEILMQCVNEERIRDCYRRLCENVRNSVELTEKDVEAVIEPLLPNHDSNIAPVVTLSRWRQVLKSLYAAGIRETVEEISTGDGFFRLTSRFPSLDFVRAEIGDRVPPAKDQSSAKKQA